MTAQDGAVAERAAAGGRPIRVMIVGTGQLSQAMQALAPTDVVDLTVLGRAELDLADAAEVAAYGGFAAADVVVCTAAFTQVDVAEDAAQREQVWAVNASAPGLIAQACAEAGTALVHVSTDYVFGSRPLPEELAAPVGVDSPPPSPQDPQVRQVVDGLAFASADPVDPEAVYGISKAAGEQQVLAADPWHVVVRTAWLLSGEMLPGVRDFASTMCRLARSGVSPKVVADQWGSPTVVTDLAVALWQLVGRVALVRACGLPDLMDAPVCAPDAGRGMPVADCSQAEHKPRIVAALAAMPPQRLARLACLVAPGMGDREAAQVGDQWVRTQCFDELAEQLAATGGVLHAAGSEPATWFHVAAELFAALPGHAATVVPCTTAEYPTAAPRPAFSVLDSGKLTQLGITPPGGYRGQVSHLVGVAPRPLG
ncbi:SDR family oxidoreductase [Corynebacterium choanae]|uniref:SDR family oxidoreductase n=1 Tax=Corynebacterium choanae TaxID=1862358 RepID=UPI0013DDB4B3|nr:NAD(P)-dependent oxidoreductase [Corynebacterium choanae]